MMHLEPHSSSAIASIGSGVMVACWCIEIVVVGGPSSDIAAVPSANKQTKSTPRHVGKWAGVAVCSHVV